MLASGLVSQLKRGPSRNSHNGDISQSLTMGYHSSPPMMCLSCASLKFHRISARDCSRVGNLAMTGSVFGIWFLSGKLHFADSLSLSQGWG